jgi:hypothetical protein
MTLDSIGGSLDDVPHQQQSHPCYQMRNDCKRLVQSFALDRYYKTFVAINLHSVPTNWRVQHFIFLKSVLFKLDHFIIVNIFPTLLKGLGLKRRVKSDVYTLSNVCR